ncbi:MAG: ferritin-like domain-containing protein [Thermodesulfobacteriota bacterium]
MKETSTGMNRTGISAASGEMRRAMESTTELTPVSANGASIAELRTEFAEESENVGSIPPPPTVKGMVKTAVGALTGESMAELLDRLAQRLAFERSGSRYYEGLITKFKVAQSAGLIGDGGPTLADLQRFHDDELRHFALLRTAIEDFGGDPTAQTPAADVAAVTGMGIGPAINDPRTDFWQSLEAILVAELTDNDAWKMLVDLASGLGYDDLATRFTVAKADEDVHLSSVRSWLHQHTMREAGAAA